MKTMFAVCVAALSLAVSAAPAARPAPAKGGHPAVSASKGGGRPDGAQAHRKDGPRAARDRMSPEDRRLIEALDDAERLGELTRLYPRALAARNPEVRAALVDALSNQGERAAGMLARLIADPDEDVADSAFQAWSSLVDEMRHLRRPAALVEAAAALQQPPVAPMPPPVAPVPGAIPAQPVPGAIPAQPVPVAR